MAPLLDHDDLKYIAEDTRIVFSFLPRKCRVSGESIWLKKAWRVRFTDWQGHLDYWYCEREYLWKILKES